MQLIYIINHIHSSLKIPAIQKSILIFLASQMKIGSDYTEARRESQETIAKNIGVSRRAVNINMKILLGKTGGTPYLVQRGRQKCPSGYTLKVAFSPDFLEGVILNHTHRNDNHTELEDTTIFSNYLWINNLDLKYKDIYKIENIVVKVVCENDNHRVVILNHRLRFPEEELDRVCIGIIEILKRFSLTPREMNGIVMYIRQNPFWASRMIKPEDWKTLHPGTKHSQFLVLLREFRATEKKLKNSDKRTFTEQAEEEISRDPDIPF